MTLLQLTILAIVQGVTEFLPISSSGHLVLAPVVMEWPDQGIALDVAVHLGSLGAVILYFHTDVRFVLTGIWDGARGQPTPARNLFGLIVLATIPVLIAGGLLAASGTMDMLRDPLVVAATTIIFGIVLFVVDKIMATVKTMDDLDWKGALVIGLAQILALIPGTSRSGITITAARYLGFTRSEAARFSMLLSIPTILAAGAVGMYQWHRQGGVAFGGDFMLAAVFSFAAALISIFLLMLLIKRMSYTPFVIYRLVLGAVLLWYFW